MAFDLSSLVGQATEFVARQQESGDNKVSTRVIYPGPGTLKVKLLYNPKSNLVARQIKRHKVGNTNYTCLSMYNMDCPICKVIDSIHNATGNDPWKFKSKFRGISFAQYVGSDNYTWDKDNPEPKIGELFILMYPWTVYQDINRIISTAGPHAAEVIASNKGKILNITQWIENSQVKYRAELDSFSEFSSNASEEEFEKFLNGLDDLNEVIVPSTLNENVKKATDSAAETLSREYLKGTGYSGMPEQMSQMQNNIAGSAQVITGANGVQYALVNGQYVPIAPAVNPTPASVTPAVAPTPQVPQMTPAPQVVPNIAPGNMGPQINEAYVPTTPQSQPIMNPPVESAPAPQASLADGTKMPECFKCHKDNDPKCMSCVYEIQCMMNV